MKMSCLTLFFDTLRAHRIREDTMMRCKALIREKTQFLVDSYLDQCILLDKRVYVARLATERDARRARMCLSENDYIIAVALENAISRLSL